MTLQTYLTRLIWWCVTPLLGLAVALGYLQFRQVRDDEAVEARRLAKVLAIEVDRTLKSRIAGLQILSLSPLLDDESRWSEFHRETQGFRAGFGGSVVLVGADRRLRLHSDVRFGDALPSLSRPRGRAAVPLAFETLQPTVGDPFMGTLANEMLVAIAVPVVRNERSDSVLLNTLPVQQLGALLTEVVLPAHWTVALYDTRGVAIASRGGQPPDAQADEVEGELRFLDKPATVPWSVEVRISRTAYVQHLWRAASILVFALLGVTLVGVVGGQWAARRLTRAVRSLAELKPGVAVVEEIDEVRAARRLLDDTLAQREAATDALQVREEQLRRIFESASEAIITADASQTIVLANPAAAQVFGRPVEQLVGAPLDSLLPERLRRQHRDDVERFGQAESATRPMGRRADVVGLRADGQEFPIEAAISQVHVDGQRLYTVILRDVTASRRLQAELEASHADLERLVTAQQRIEEEERKRIARELHDDLQQVLAAIKMDVGSIETELAVDPARLRPLVARIDELATTAITSSRRIVNDLRPLLLEELGLGPALEALCRQFSARTGIAARLDSDEDCSAPDAMPEATAICLYRLAQESLNNAAKHSKARHVHLRLTSPAPGRWALRIADDGQGLQPGDLRKPMSFGLRGMAERVRALGGTLRVEGVPGRGVVVEVEIGSAHAPKDAAG